MKSKPDVYSEEFLATIESMYNDPVFTIEIIKQFVASWTNSKIQHKKEIKDVLYDLARFLDAEIRKEERYPCSKETSEPPS